MPNKPIPPPSERFRDNLKAMLEEIEEMFEEAADEGLIKYSKKLFFVVKTLISRGRSEYMISLFIKRTNEHWEHIRNQDGSHIEDILSKIFGMVQDGKLEDIKKDEDLKGAGAALSMISKGSIENLKTVLISTYKDEDGDEIKFFDEKRKEYFWDLLKGSVRVSLCHIHKTRIGHGNNKPKADFFPEIKVKETAELWKAKLI